VKIALDTNVLLYASAVWRVEADKPKTDIIRIMLSKISDDAEIVAPYQTFGEGYNAMQRIGHSREKCRQTILEWRDRFEVLGSSEESFLSAVDLATEHKLQFWDALVVNVAADAGCSLLLSEDMQDGFAWRGVTVVNPFAEKIHKRLARVFSG
jgi:predicted nucleic acid-binding protein